MYEPTDYPLALEFGVAAALLLVYVIAVVIVAWIRSPETRGLAGAAETLIELARRIDRRRAALILGAIIAVLTSLGALVAYSTSEALHIWLFRLNEERTVPTSFNSLQLFVAATLALLLAHGARGVTRSAWLALALALVAGGFDESAGFHERFERRVGAPEELVLIPLGGLILAALIILWRRLRASPPALPLLLAAGAMVLLSQGFDLIDETWSQRIVEEAFELIAGALLLLSMLAAAQGPRPGRETAPPHPPPALDT